MPDTAEPDRELEALLTYLKQARGFDFTGYKRASLTRRIQHRMHQVGVDDYGAYTDLLEANPGEFGELFDTILINVTAFLRDPEAWEFLASDVIPDIVRSRAPGDPIRIWSAGTASGEEAYSLAVLLAEEVGDDRFRSSVKIYATDADEEALVQARHARYPAAAVVKAFGEERAGRFFETDGPSSLFRQDLRRSLVFGRHDLVQHPPISRIDLLVCRNTLMYFTAEMQRRVLANFHFALSEAGYLFLGKSEAMVTRTAMFETVNLKCRVFRRLPHAEASRTAFPDMGLVAGDRPALSEVSAVVGSAFEESPLAQVVIDRHGTAVAVNRHARALFGLGLDAAGSALKDLQLSYRPVELRSIVDDVMLNGRPVTLSDVEWTTPSGTVEYLDIAVLPFSGAETSGVVVSYMEVGRYKHLRDDLERSRGELENAYEELQSTAEELETTNEELQSTNEELETTNEELHSTNEELETMNEELQSTNEELETANGELRDRSMALDEANGFLQSILSSLTSGVVVLTNDLSVRVWNAAAGDMWGLRADEVEGSHFLNLDIGLPVDRLRTPIRECLNGSSEAVEVQLPALNRRGRAIDCLVRVTALREGSGVTGVILVMEAVEA